MRTRWLSLGLVVAVIGSACKREGARGEAPATSPSVTTADTAWDSPGAVRLSGVHYTPPAQAFGVLGVTSSDYFDSIGPCYKIATFVDGKYRGADLVSAERRTDEPCKGPGDRKSTRLNSSHLVISYAVFCLKKKKNISLSID